MMKSSDGFLNYFQINSKHARVFSLSLSLSLSREIMASLAVISLCCVL
jgi:hypothetical protein